MRQLTVRGWISHIRYKLGLPFEPLRRWLRRWLGIEQDRVYIEAQLRALVHDAHGLAFNVGLTHASIYHKLESELHFQRFASRGYNARITALESKLNPNPAEEK